LSKAIREAIMARSIGPRARSRAAFLIALSACVSDGCGRKPPTPLAASPGRVVDPKGLFDFALPEGWYELSPPPAGASAKIQRNSAAIDAVFAENINVVATPLPADLSDVPLYQFVAADLKASAAKRPGLAYGATRSLLVDGVRAQQVSITVNIGGAITKGRMTYIRRDAVLYLVTHASLPTTDPKIDDAAASVIRTWRFAK
jgi:hypothetical protein